METVTLTTENVGCHLDNHRGHYITRDAIELAIGYGFIVGGFEKFGLDRYEKNGSDDNYPHEELHELCDMAVQWLNSGQDKCSECFGDGGIPRNNGPYWVDRGGDWRCTVCTGTGRGPRESGQNFPPIVPEGAVWMFNDGDFGLYIDEDESEA